MRIHKYLFIIIIFSSFISSQSMYGAYGLGLNKAMLHTSTNGGGGIGLAPLFHQGTSIDNISTWPNLGATFISASYIAEYSQYDKSKSPTNFSGISGFQFIAPFKDRFAIGLSLKPVNATKSSFITDTSSIVYNDSELSTSKFLTAGGGILMASFGISFPLSQNFGVGVSLNNYFGSTRDQQSIYIEPYNYRLFNIRSFSGSTIGFDMSGNIFSINNKNLIIFSKLTLTPSPLSAILYTFDMYEDRNNNYAFDAADYPNEIKVDTVFLDNTYAPFELSLGASFNFNENLILFSEIQNFNDNGTNTNLKTILNDKINNKSHAGIGLVRYGNSASRSWQDQLTTRIGISQNKYKFNLSDKKIIENGISFGIGYKFGLMGNQIDLSFKVGNRESERQKELIQEFNISISLGDIWFLKRRK